MKVIALLIGLFAATVASADNYRSVKVNHCADLLGYDWENQFLLEDVLDCKFVVQ
jgi:hypothetical protein